MDRMLKVSKYHISQNYEFKTHAKFTLCCKDECYKNPKVCFDHDFIAKNNVFFKLDVLKNSMKFELRNSIKEVSVI